MARAGGVPRPAKPARQTRYELLRAQTSRVLRRRLAIHLGVERLSRRSAAATRA